MHVYECFVDFAFIRGQVNGVVTSSESVHGVEVDCLIIFVIKYIWISHCVETLPVMFWNVIFHQYLLLRIHVLQMLMSWIGRIHVSDTMPLLTHNELNVSNTSLRVNIRYVAREECFNVLLFRWSSYFNSPRNKYCMLHRQLVIKIHTS